MTDRQSYVDAAKRITAEVQGPGLALREFRRLPVDLRNAVVAGEGYTLSNEQAAAVVGLVHRLAVTLQEYAELIVDNVLAATAEGPSFGDTP